jgi:hypothetical protein
MEYYCKKNIGEGWLDCKRIAYETIRVGPYSGDPSSVKNRLMGSHFGGGWVRP